MRRFASFLQTFVEFLLHFVIAVPGSVVLTLIMTLIFLKAGIWHTWGDNNIWFSWRVWICGLVLGIVANTLLGQRKACLIWLVGVAWITLEVCLIPHNYPSDLVEGRTEMIVSTLFPTGLPNSILLNGDGMAFTIFTIPAMNAFSYSIGAAIGLALHKLSAREKDGHSRVLIRIV